MKKKMDFGEGVMKKERGKIQCDSKFTDLGRGMR